jgi:glycine cleavage system H protein
MQVPDTFQYSADHEWVAVNGDTVRIGITDYAQDALGDVVYVQAPNVGDVVKAGGSLGEVESTKSVSDVYSPVSGTVVSVNTALADAPESLNSDPYGAGWICEIAMSNPSELQSLLSPDAYRSLVAG